MRAVPAALFGLALLLAGPAMAQDIEGGGSPAAQVEPARLHAMQDQLDLLRGDLERLRQELAASGPAGFAAAGGDSAIDRMNAMERQLTALTSQFEEWRHRIERIVADGNNRVGDLEFRLCEIDQNCDLGALLTPAPLGTAGTGGGSVEYTPLPPANLPDAATAEERADFAAAETALAAGRYDQAATLFAEVASKHSGGALTAEALFQRGVALERGGRVEDAAGAWLESFSADPAGTRAGASLTGLAQAMATLGHIDDACAYLDEGRQRFADRHDPAASGLTERLGCADRTGDDPEALADEALDE